MFYCMLSVTDKGASLAAILVLHPVYTHLFACFLTLTYCSAKQFPPQGICWNRLNGALAWLFYCCILSATLILLLQRCNLQLPPQHDQISFSFHLYYQTLTLIWPFWHGFQYWHDLLWSNKYFCWHLFCFDLCLFVFLFCLHFCIQSRVEIIRCMVKSLVATSTYIYIFFELLLKKKTRKVFFGRESLGTQACILVSQMVWICHCFGV